MPNKSHKAKISAVLAVEVVGLYFYCHQQVKSALTFSLQKIIWKCPIITNNGKGYYIKLSLHV